MLEQEQALWAAVHRREVTLASKNNLQEGYSDTTQAIIYEGDIAIEALALQYDSSVKYVMVRTALNFGPLTTPDDQYQNGRLGLVEAIRSFNPNNGAPFLSYAIPHIRGAMLDAERDASFLPRSATDRGLLVERVTNRFFQNHGTKLTESELLKLCQTKDQLLKTTKQLRQAQQALSMTIVSLDEPIDDEGDGVRGDFVTDDANVTPEQAVIRAEEMISLRGAITTLQRRDQILINLHYEKGMTFAEIARILETSESAVFQLHDRVKKRLRRQLGITDSISRKCFSPSLKWSKP
ncbi:sigma-70 family RNA polymerase sigma factor [Candidatus Daviesbacteria bacterium]|nr:sigma-70 family RNA polymerase sigma factor [Candidatus Daviesbacteria bacterium]